MSSDSFVAPLTFRKVLALRGPNTWANFPVLEVWVDLAGLKDTSSEMIPGFNDRLKNWLPTLIEHRCSVGERGGFFERLRRGTYMAHILEHVVLELQSLAGTEVGYGRARELDEEGVYRVAIEYQEESLARAALEVGRRLVLAAVDDQQFDVTGEIAKLRELAYDVCLGPSTRSIVDAAKKRGIPFFRLNSGSLVQLGYGSRQRRILTAETDRTPAIAESIAQDKELTRRLLKVVGVPVPDGRPVENAEDAWEAALDIGLPVVVKPQYGNHGRGVTTNLYTRDEVVRAYENARREESTVMVEKFFEGSDYRLLVVGNRLIAAARREPAQVTGNGKSTVRELVEEVNRDPRRSDGHATIMSHIKMDDVSLAVLEQQGFSWDSVPTPGQIVLIRRNANLSSGGTACDVTAQVHPDVAARAVEAAQMVGLDIAGVDVVARDISIPLENQNAGIVEVNAGPGLRMHLQPSEGQGQPVGEAIVDLLFKPEDNGRIPVVSVTGVNGKTTTVRLIAHILFLQGKRVGFTSTDGVYIAGRRIDSGDCSGPQSGRRILQNPNVDAAVLETARGGILREGVCYDRSDVGVVTNIGEGDHLGIAGVETPEQLARVKRTVIDSVSKEGSGVLNADDPLTVAMAEHCSGQVVWFSFNPENEHVVARRKAGGKAVFVRDNAMILAHGESEFTLLTLDRIPITHGGKIRFQVENAMAGAAAAWTIGVPAEVIRAGLESFQPSIDGTPGRFNILQYGSLTLVVDYGHNPSALKGVLDALQGFPNKRRTAVYSAAGDRRDGDMIRQGQLLGHHFDRVILYEGDYVRGRQPGDIIQLFREGLALGARVRHKAWFTAWKDSVDNAIQNSEPGELILIQADVVDESVEFFRELLLKEPPHPAIAAVPNPTSPAASAKLT